MIKKDSNEMSIQFRIDTLIMVVDIVIITYKNIGQSTRFINQFQSYVCPKSNEMFRNFFIRLPVFSFCDNYFK